MTRNKKTDLKLIEQQPCFDPKKDKVHQMSNIGKSMWETIFNVKNTDKNHNCTCNGTGCHSFNNSKLFKK
jgi:hypothetical protein